MTDHDIPECGDCGQRHVVTAGPSAGHPSCAGHISPGRKDADPNPRAGQPCRRTPCRGQRVCPKHGGSSPQAKAAAIRRLAEQRAAVELNRMIPDQAEPIRDPIAVLARLGGEADTVRGRIVAMVNVLTDDLDPADLDLEQLESIAAFVTLYERFLQTTGRFCQALVKSNYLERRAAIDAADTARVLAAVQDGLNVIPDRMLRRAVAERVASNLRGLQTSA